MATVSEPGVTLSEDWNRLCSQGRGEFPTREGYETITGMPIERYAQLLAIHKGRAAREQAFG